MSTFTFVAAYVSASLHQLQRRDEKGATAVEYGLLVALIAAVIVAVVATLGGKIGTAFSTVNNNLP
jgi:pilus assembly protein Flp/PilA